MIHYSTNYAASVDSNATSSYIGSVMLRERDANTSWVSASDGTLEERRYYCQNWRADVSAIITSGGVMVEWAKYSPYGIPFGLPGADTDSDGDCDATDITNMNYPPGSYDVRYDIDLDGDNDATDKAIAQTYYLGTTYGWDILSSNPDTGTGNRKGCAGYEYDSNISMYHIRNRVLHPELGRWTRRDPLGYVDGMNVYEYVGSIPITNVDHSGLLTKAGCFNLGFICALTNPGVRDIFMRLKDKGCVPTVRCIDESDERCKVNENISRHGFYCCSSNTVYMCADSFPDSDIPDKFCQTLANELSHSEDDCDGLFTCEDTEDGCGGISQANGCNDYLMTELCSIWRSGECCQTNHDLLLMCLYTKLKRYNQFCKIPLSDEELLKFIEDNMPLNEENPCYKKLVPKPPISTVFPLNRIPIGDIYQKR